MEQLLARRQPDMQRLAMSNQQPSGAFRIPLEQRRTIITVESAKCRWPVGDPQESGFYLCGAGTTAEHSYCDHHMKMAYTPPSRTRR